MILDTFALLYKSNSADLIKGNKAAEKSTDDLQGKLKKTGESAVDLGKEYTKVIESAVSAFTALVSVRSLAGGLFDTAQTNSQLQIQSKLLGENVVDLKAYGQAAEAAGASASDFSSYLQQAYDQFAASNVRFPGVTKFVQGIRNDLKEAAGDIQLQNQIFQRLGINSPGLKSFFLLPENEFQKQIASQKELNANVQKGADVARDYEQSWSKTNSTLRSVFTTIGNDLLPAFTDTNSTLQEFFTNLSKDPKRAEVAFASISIAAISLTSVITRLGLALSTAFGGALGLVGLGSYLVYDKVKNGKDSLVGQGVQDIMNRLGVKPYTSAAKGAPSLGGSASLKDALIKSSSESINNNDSPELAAQRARRDGSLSFLDMLKTGQSALSFATNTPLSTLGSGNAGGDKNINIKIGDVNVHTNGTTSNDIASHVSADLITQIRSAFANFDDGVNR